MAKAVFYEKPGCANNLRQKKLLQEKGLQLEAKNLLTEPWTAAKLIAFFNGLPVNAWFNQNAPLIKSGQLRLDMLSEKEAIECMLLDPILIRRPLIEIGGRRIVGFETEQINMLCEDSIDTGASMENCTKALKK